MEKREKEGATLIAQAKAIAKAKQKNRFILKLAFGNTCDLVHKGVDGAKSR